MTDDQQSDLSATEQAQQSLSGLLDTPELLRVRIRPADFARALGVSKQSVSRWVRDGWVQLAADGRLDPTVAIGQLLRRCDPGRLRARWLRQAVTEVQELREAAASADARVAEVEARLGAELAAAHRRIEYLDHFAADLDCMLEGVLDLMRDSELALRGTRDTDEWLELVDRIEGAAAEACGPEDWSMPDELDALAARDTTTQGGAGE